MYRVEETQKGFWYRRKVMILRQSSGFAEGKVRKIGVEGTELLTVVR